ncbi:hypothetical protein QM334_05980 [Burkholderia cenocepacia]|nr:hypothetical protein [Burkholderia cenocepacia]
MTIATEGRRQQRGYRPSPSLERISSIDRSRWCVAICQTFLHASFTIGRRSRYGMSAGASSGIACAASARPQVESVSWTYTCKNAGIGPRRPSAPLITTTAADPDLGRQTGTEFAFRVEHRADEDDQVARIRNDDPRRDGMPSIGLEWGHDVRPPTRVQAGLSSSSGSLQSGHRVSTTHVRVHRLMRRSRKTARIRRAFA